ncbi:hypothetical protein SDC9_81212 [bioreactor metagenome]|uniref:Uncharacterized protein n=1 Tax=bioreactor metagenome TaxID=1076179 RepID=A0A644Z1B2_9ZZZZ
MPAGHLRRKRLGAKRTADAPDLIGGDGNADARGADNDAPVAHPGGDSLGGGLAKDGVIAAVGGVAAEIPVGHLVGVQPGLNVLLEGEAPVVGTKCKHVQVSFFNGYSLINRGFRPW